MKVPRPFDGLALGTLAGIVLLTWALFRALPERVPTHFDAGGNADGWMSRSWGAWLLPVVAAATFFLVRFGGRLLPLEWRDRAQRSPMDVAAFLTVALLAAIQCVVLHVALRGSRSAGPALGIALGVFWTAFGLVLPKIRRNPFVGIRTTWTLSSDEIWAVTHRTGSWTFVLGGSLAAILSLAGAMPWPFVVIASSALVPVAHSYLLARGLPPKA